MARIGNSGRTVNPYDRQRDAIRSRNAAMGMTPGQGPRIAEDIDLSDTAGMARFNSIPENEMYGWNRLRERVAAGEIPGQGPRIADYLDLGNVGGMAQMNSVPEIENGRFARMRDRVANGSEIGLRRRPQPGQGLGPGITERIGNSARTVDPYGRQQDAILSRYEAMERQAGPRMDGPRIAEDYDLSDTAAMARMNSRPEVENVGFRGLRNAVAEGRGPGLGPRIAENNWNMGNFDGDPLAEIPYLNSVPEIENDRFRAEINAQKGGYELGYMNPREELERYRMWRAMYGDE